jgi:hypothetical protein
MALQVARIGYYAQVVASGREVTLCVMTTDVVYSIAFFWALHVCRLMSERSIQVALLAVLISWCIMVGYWSASKCLCSMRSISYRTRCRLGIAVTTAVMLGVPIVVVGC